MSLIKNLRRREVEIFGAKRVVRNGNKKEEKIEPETEAKPKTRAKKQTKNKEE